MSQSDKFFYPTYFGGEETAGIPLQLFKKSILDQGRLLQIDQSGNWYKEHARIFLS